jgi:predicted ATPase/DNA-binding SARP family transcriptional activator
VEFRILGPLELLEDGRLIELAGSRQRGLLALLLVHANEVVSSDRLIDGLWGPRPPATATKGLQNAVSLLRRSVGDDLIITRAPGYLLRVEPDTIDARRFESLVDDGTRALAAGDASGAARILREGLGLWRGPALDEFAFEPFAEAEAARLEARRLRALEERIDADLALGRFVDVIGELEGLVGEHPLRERPRGQLMLALYGSGRQAEALQVYQDGRRLLADELGLEPGAALQQLEKQVLTHDPALVAAPVVLQAAADHRRGAASGAPDRTLGWTNLPAQGTPLVGRKRELDETMALLQEHRLLTLVGPPGTGKTRLALQLAAGAVDTFDHVWWVALHEIRDPELVEPTIARTVGAGSDLSGYLRDRSALLVLDNLEQVLGCAPRLAGLVAGSISLKVVATSREPLNLRLEQQYPVEPLPEDDAVALFTERARAVRPGFDANDAVAAICRRLDGLPLAIELAAARVKMLPPDVLLARLEQRLQLLIHGARDLPERQRTLRAAIAWSYDLLDAHEQELFARLSVFAGGWTLDAAEAVCDCELETLASLVDKSLLREDESRFSMLETIREYALERVGERDEGDDVRSRHAEYFLVQAEANRGELFSDFLRRDQLDWFERERDNLRAALDQLHEPESAPELELRLVVACHPYWLQRGYWTEGRRRIDAALYRARDAAAPLRARTLLLASSLDWRQGDARGGKELAEAALTLYRELGTSGRELVIAYIALALCESKLGNVERAGELYGVAAASAREASDERSLAVIAHNIASDALDQRDYARARTYFRDSVSLSRRLKSQALLANSLSGLGVVALAMGRLEDATAAYRESLLISRAERLASTLISVVEGLAAVALERDTPAEAARLLAATDRPKDELALAADIDPIQDEMRERTLETARATLGDAAFAAAWREGEDLTLELAAERAALVE